MVDFNHYQSGKVQRRHAWRHPFGAGTGEYRITPVVEANALATCFQFLSLLRRKSFRNIIQQRIVFAFRFYIDRKWIATSSWGYSKLLCFARKSLIRIRIEIIKSVQSHQKRVHAFCYYLKHCKIRSKTKKSYGCVYLNIQ